MAQWRDEGHAISALFILGRIAGIEETHLLQIVFSHDVHEILDRMAN